jgi:hypothetical protein
MTGRTWLVVVTVFVIAEGTLGALSPLLGGRGGSAVIGESCCPVGGHPNGLCPMHKSGGPSSAATANRALPRWTCSCAPSVVALLPVGPVTSHVTITEPAQMSVAPVLTPAALLDGPSVPTSPPPRN